jgi:hypothetical protein
MEKAILDFTVHALETSLTIHGHGILTIAMFGVHVHVRGTCLCSGYMSMFGVHVHVRGTWPCGVHGHVRATWPCVGYMAMANSRSLVRNFLWCLMFFAQFGEINPHVKIPRTRLVLFRNSQCHCNNTLSLRIVDIVRFVKSQSNIRRLIGIGRPRKVIKLMSDQIFLPSSGAQ